MFSNLSSSSISFATVTPSLVTTGAPRLLDHHVPALRTEGDLHCVRERIDTGQDLVLGGHVEEDFLRTHD
jgi:hypothetical protein